MKEELFTRLRDKAPLCACGCGTPTKWNKWHRRWRTYILGHNRKGKKLSAEIRAKISATEKGKVVSAETRAKMSKAKTGKNNPFYRKHLSVERRRNSSGPNNGNWKNGASLENRPPELTTSLIQSIRKRDNFQCQFCGVKRKKGHRKLDTHHIDDDRRNNHPDNLITLCKECHGETKTIGDKAAWQRVYTNLIKKIKRENPEGHQAAVELYEQNIKIYY